MTGPDDDDDLGGLPPLPPVGTAEETAELDPAEGLDLGESEGVGLDDAEGLDDDFDAADLLDVDDAGHESMLDGEEAGDSVGSLGSAIDDAGGEYGWTDDNEAPEQGEWDDDPLIDEPADVTEDDDGALGLEDDAPLGFAGDEPTDLPPLDRSEDLDLADYLDLGAVLELRTFSEPPPAPPSVSTPPGPNRGRPSAELTVPEARLVHSSDRPRVILGRRMGSPGEVLAGGGVLAPCEIADAAHHGGRWVVLDEAGTLHHAGADGDFAALEGDDWERIAVTDAGVVGWRTSGIGGARILESGPQRFAGAPVADARGCVALVSASIGLQPYPLDARGVGPAPEADALLGAWRLVQDQPLVVFASATQAFQRWDGEDWERVHAADGGHALVRLGDRFVSARTSARGTHDVLWMLPAGGGAGLWLDLAQALRDNGEVPTRDEALRVRRMTSYGEVLFVEIGAGVLRVVEVPGDR